MIGRYHSCLLYTSNAFKQVEAYEFNTICVDTEDTSVHLLLQSFINRIFDAASLTQAVVAEKHTVDLETREAHAASFNDEKMHYVLNAHVNEQGTEIDGYQTAARIAGMIGAVAANSSLTHTVVSGFSEIKEKLTNTETVSYTHLDVYKRQPWKRSTSPAFFPR